MPVNLDSFTGEGSTPSRRRFWDKVTAAVIASQKVEGKNVSVSEHQGMGTLINVTRGRSGFVGCPNTVTFSGLEFCCIANNCEFPPAGSTKYFEPPTINGVTIPLSDISFPPDCPIFCQADAPDSPALGITTYSDQDCSAGASDDTIPFLTASVLKKDGVWHIALTDGGFGTFFFYATTTDISGPVANILSCDTPDRCARNLDDMDPELEVCLFGGIFGVFVLIGGFNGTATFA